MSIFAGRVIYSSFSMSSRRTSFSTASAPLVDHFKSYAEDLKKDFLQKNDLVVDIGSNDGILLQFLTGICRVLGIEPSANVAEVARKKGIETLPGFFTVDMAKKMVEKYGKAKVVTANKVFCFSIFFNHFLQIGRA